MALGNYDLSLLQLSIGGRSIGGFGEDGAVEVAFVSDISESKVSGDGDAVIVSRLNDPRVTVTITVMENTKAARILGELAAAQALLPAYTPLVFMMADPLSGDALGDQYTIFQGRPGISKGKTAGERAWVLLLPNGAKGMVHAALIP